jgi:phospholipid/cholesterol/gamma-HCH transport system substrate-binding protein
MTKVVIFTVVSVVVTSIVISSLLDINTHSATGYYAEFTDASGLQTGDTVRIAGVEVGKVSSVTLQGNHAEISFSVDTNQHLTTATKATIDFENLLGQCFLAILPGSAGGKPLPPGSVIPLSRTTPGLNLTAVFDGFAPLFSALAPNEVNELTASIIQVFQGEAGTMSSLVQETAAVTANLADRQQVIDVLLNNLSTLLDTVGVHDTQLGQLIGNFDTLVRSIASSRTDLGSAITNMSSLESTTANLINQAQPTFNQDIHTLASDVQTLAANQANLNGVLRSFPGLVNVLAKVQSSGNWINVYLCDLTINVHGKLDISLVPGVSPPQYPDPVTLPSGAVGDQAVHTASCS